MSTSDGEKCSLPRGLLQKITRTGPANESRSGQLSPILVVAPARYPVKYTDRAATGRMCARSEADKWAD